MALEAKGKKIYMDEYDFGRSIPFTLEGVDILPTDKLLMRIRRNKKSPLILEKIFDNSATENGKFTFALSFTEKESKLLPANDYSYSLKQIRDTVLVDTIIDEEVFTVRSVI
jgi:hypothetical protein